MTHLIAIDPDPNALDVMVDLETLGTTADSAILSIGAVRFNIHGDSVPHEGPDTFYAEVSIDSNIKRGRRIDGSTLAWWMQQDQAARRVFTNKFKPDLTAALEVFVDWFAAAGRAAETRLWSNGADFDIPMLNHALKTVDMTPPWKFFNHRCLRTLRDLPGVDMIERPAPTVAHNALSDAVAQARYTQMLWAALRAKEA